MWEYTTLLYLSDKMLAIDENACPLDLAIQITRRSAAKTALIEVCAGVVCCSASLCAAITFGVKNRAPTPSGCPVSRSGS